MFYPDYEFRGHKTCLKSKTLIGKISEIIRPEGSEHYVSIQRFTSSILKLESLASIPEGTKAYADDLIFDLDCADDLEKALSDTRTLVQSLEEVGAVFTVWFSGNKGFHVIVPTSQFGYEPTTDFGILKRMAQAIAGEIPSWDDSIYNPTRVFRSPFSWNEKGGRWKIPIEVGWTIERILHRASQRPYLEEHDQTSVVPQNQALIELYEACKVRVNRVVHEHVTDWDGSILAPAPEGKRNETAYKTARRLARRAFSQKDATFIMQAWNQSLDKPLPEYELKKVVDNAFKSGGVNEMVEEETLSNHIHDIRTLVSSTHEAIKAQGKGGFRTGYQFLDEYTYGFQKGDVIFWIARAGTLKTANLTNILQRGSFLAKKPALLFEMEMNRESFTPRLIQQSHGFGKADAIDYLAQNDYSEKAAEMFRYLKTVHRSNLTIEGVVGFIDYYLETFGEICAVGIDYLGLFKGCANDSSKTAKYATEIKTIVAKAADCPVFCLVQANREYEGGGGDVEITRTAAKDSGYIEDSGDYLIGSWWHMVTHPETGAKHKMYFGKFMKSRGYNSKLYEENPYFCIDADPATMTINDYIYLEDVSGLSFKQAGEKK